MKPLSAFLLNWILRVFPGKCNWNWNLYLQLNKTLYEKLIRTPKGQTVFGWVFQRGKKALMLNMGSWRHLLNHASATSHSGWPQRMPWPEGSPPPSPPRSAPNDLPKGATRDSSDLYHNSYELTCTQLFIQGSLPLERELFNIIIVFSLSLSFHSLTLIRCLIKAWAE